MRQITIGWFRLDFFSMSPNIIFYKNSPKWCSVADRRTHKQSKHERHVTLSTRISYLNLCLFCLSHLWTLNWYTDFKAGILMRMLIYSCSCLCGFLQIKAALCQHEDFPSTDIFHTVSAFQTLFIMFIKYFSSQGLYSRWFVVLIQRHWVPATKSERTDTS